MLKTGIVIASIAALAACGSSSSNNYGATLAAANETPPNASTATGDATVTVNGTTANYVVNFSGLSGAPTASHIHVGASGAAGPVVVPFSVTLPSATSGTFQGSFSQSDIHASTTPIAVATFDDLVAQMKAGNAYVNIHTAANPGGEIRGQLSPK